MKDPISLDEIAKALELTPIELEEILNRLPCESDRDLARLMRVKERKIRNLRHRMKSLLKDVQMGYGRNGRNGAGRIAGAGRVLDRRRQR